METANDCFPRFESIKDSLGTVWTPKSPIDHSTGLVLRPGDSLEFVLTASDPLGESLQYRVIKGDRNWSDGGWSDSCEFSIGFADYDVRKHFIIHFQIRSLREYHAHGHYDDSVMFFYDVLPRPKIE
jgi:hypothetical protein